MWLWLTAPVLAEVSACLRVKQLYMCEEVGSAIFAFQVGDGDPPFICKLCRQEHSLHLYEALVCSPLLLQDKYKLQIQVAAGIKKLNKVLEIVFIKCIGTLSFEECMKVEVKAHVLILSVLRRKCFDLPLKESENEGPLLLSLFLVFLVWFAGFMWKLC